MLAQARGPQPQQKMHEIAPGRWSFSMTLQGSPSGSGYIVLFLMLSAASAAHPAAQGAANPGRTAVPRFGPRGRVRLVPVG